MSDAALRVRVACAADLAEILRMERATDEAPHWDADAYAAMLVDRSEKVDRSEGSCAVARRLLVAEMDGVVGFAVAKVLRVEQNTVAELESVAVVESVRRRGIGRALCDAAIAWCREQGAAAMELEVRASSRGALALYTTLGFVETGQRREYYRHPTEDAVLMELKLR